MTATTEEPLLPGYWIDEETGAWCSIPWPTDPDEKESIIKSSLGMQIINWSEGRTDEPGLMHYMHGTPWRWTAGQKRFLILWYLLDAHGRFVYRSGVKRGAKGTGKDPMLAAMCNTELLGPVEPYDRDDKTGLWIGRARGFPLVQVMSNSEDQSKKVLRIANGMWSKAAREHYNLDCGETRTVIKGVGARFEIPTSAEQSSEGDPITFAGLNETHHMTSSTGGDENANVIRRNVAKSPASVQARAVEFTNAHQQGMASVAEESFQAWQAQLDPGYRGRQDILYDSIEAPPDTDILSEEGRLRGLAAAYMDADWNDKQRISDEMMDRRTSVADSIRFYLNGLGGREDAWVEPANWDRLAAGGTVVGEKERVAIFADCSKTGDATGIVGCRLSDQFLFQIGCWERPHGLPSKVPWQVPREAVDAKIRWAMDTYKVVWLGIDPSPAKEDSEEALYWQAMIDGLHRDFHKKLPLWATPGNAAGGVGNAVLFDMRLSQWGAARRNQIFTEAAMYLASMVDSEEPLEAIPVRHDGSAKLRMHVHNARKRPNQWGVSLGKVTRNSSKHVDLAVCAVGAIMGARAALNSGKIRRKASSGKVVVLS